MGPFPVPTIIQAIDGFALGVKATNPAAKVRLVWTQSWYNPPHEREAAQSLINVGADVVGQFADSPTVCQTAEATGKWCVGSNSDLSKFAPKYYLTGHVWHWTGLFVKDLIGASQRHLEAGHAVGQSRRRHGSARTFEQGHSG